MTSLELIIIGSGTSLIGLVLLFYVEARRGRRFGTSLRMWLDRVVDWLVIRWHTLMLYIGSGAIRVGLHLLIHRALHFCSNCLAFLYGLVERWQRRNRQIARTVHRARTESHLTAIADHRSETALSPKEKADLKERSLQG